MYFLTEQDPNYRIKGSRDPLGFQPLWQSLGRTVVQHLSTVSGNLKDFQILSYAWYFYGDRDPKNFLQFFYKFEQAYGFARGAYIKDDAFNGIDFVRKNLNRGVFTFSTRNKDTLLSNQKSYGIYGKYNRPFTEMHIKEQEDFRLIIENALKQKVDFQDLKQKVGRLLDQEICEMSIEGIEIFAKTILSTTEEERAFFERLILHSEESHVQNELFRLLNTHEDLTQFDNFNLFAFIDAVRQKNPSTELLSKLEEIEKSERVLTPFVYLFKTLQTAPIWKLNDVENESIFQSFPKAFNYDFKKDIISDLNNSLSKGAAEKAIDAIQRNKAVSENRGNSAWIKFENNELITCYADGGRHVNEFNTDVDFEHNYFLPTYVSMYKQIMA